jgi:hypothetical protein
MKSGRTLQKYYCGVLFNPHAIPVRKEPVSFLHGMLIRPENAFAPREGRYQHQKRGLREVEVREQGAGHAKLESGIDKDVRFA